MQGGEIIDDNDEEETLPKPLARTSSESQDIYDDNLAVESDKNELFQTIRLIPDGEIGVNRPKKEISKEDGKGVEGFNPSKEGPTHDDLEAYYAKFGAGKYNYKQKTKNPTTHKTTQTLIANAKKTQKKV